MLEHPDCSCRFEPCLSAVQEDIGLKLHRVQMQVPIEGLTDGSLRRHESEDRPAIMAQDKPGKSRTQHTMTVENDDWTVIGKGGYGWIIPVAVGLEEHRLFQSSTIEICVGYAAAIFGMMSANDLRSAPLHSG